MLPRIPSGRTENSLPLGMPDLPVVCDGNVPSAVIHVKDIGRYIARIITDSRTLNRKVFAYNELHTSKEVSGLV